VTFLDFEEIITLKATPVVTHSSTVLPVSEQPYSETDIPDLFISYSKFDFTSITYKL
jgi:hypothetical protein